MAAIMSLITIVYGLADDCMENLRDKVNHPNKESGSGKVFT